MASLENVKDFWEKTLYGPVSLILNPIRLNFIMSIEILILMIALVVNLIKGFYPKSTKMIKIKKYLI